MDVDLLTELLDVGIRRVEDLHQPLILLKVDQLQPVVELVLPQQVAAPLVLLVLVLGLFTFARLELVFECLPALFGLRPLLLVKIVEVLRMLDDLGQELAMACFFAVLLTAAHRLLKPVDGSSLSLRLLKSLGALVEIAVKQLPRVEQVAEGAAPRIDHLTVVNSLSDMVQATELTQVVCKYTLTQILLKAVQFEHFKVAVSCRSVGFAGKLIRCDDLLVLPPQLGDLVDSVDVCQVL